MRRRKADRREVPPDPKFNSPMVHRFVAIVMTHGQKSVAEKIVYNALELLAQKSGEENAIKALNKVLDNVRPRLEVKPRRVGGATYQVPVEVSVPRGNSLALRWIRDFARNKKGKPMQSKLADELLMAYKGEGSAMKKRDEVHKMADANKAFSHLRW